MWEYFGSLYKNCNKGIKGRGKDRRISNSSFSSFGEPVPKEEDSSRRNSYSSMASISSNYPTTGTSESLDGMLQNGGHGQVPTMVPDCQPY